MQSVADFGDAASTLATRYRPMVAGVSVTCVERASYRALGNPGPYDLAEAQRQADELCAPLRKQAESARLLADALDGYATALGRLSGVKKSTFDAEIRSVSLATEKLKARDGTALIPRDALEAASKIAATATQVLLMQRTEALTRGLLEDHQAALAQVLGAMKTYAADIYTGELAATRETLRDELDRLVAASNAPQQADVESRLPYRWAQRAAYADLAANEEQTRQARALGEAADALVAAHATLAEHFEILTHADRLMLVADFVDKVHALRDGAVHLTAADTEVHGVSADTPTDIPEEEP